MGMERCHFVSQICRKRILNFVGNKILKAFPLPVMSSYCQKTFPLLVKKGKFEQWKFRIQYYLKNEHYALWEVIKFGDSYEAPKDVVDTGSASEGSAKKKERTVAVTTEDMQKRRNDVKARTTLLLAFPDEHQLRFSKYKTAQELWAAILKTFGRNEATKKTKKNQLKQQYSNFKAEEWLMYTIMWRNRSDLDTMSLDDIYNHLKVYEPEVQKKSESNSQNMAFISLAKNSSGNREVNTASIPTASTQVSPASANIDEYDIEEMDIKWNMALLSMRADRYLKKTGKKISIQGTDVAGFDKSKVECFNCHKMGHFAREYRPPRSQDRGRRENFKQGSKVEESALKALMTIDGVGWDWNYMANEEEDHALVADQEAPTEFAFMAKSSSDTEVFDYSLCSKAFKKNTYSLNTKITDLTEKLSDSKTMLYHYKLGLSQVKARLVDFKNQEIKLCEKIRGLEFKVESKTNRIESLTNELEMLKKEKEGLDSKLTCFQSTSKDLDTLLGSQRPSHSIETNDLQNNSSSVSENVESTSSILSKPEIKFVKAADSPTVIKINKDETVRKPSVKYAEMYRKTSKGSNARGNQKNWNNLKSQQLGKNFLMKNKACFNCGDFNHLAYDCGKWLEMGKSRPKNNTHKSIPPRTVFHKSDRSPTRITRPNINAAQPNRTSTTLAAATMPRTTIHRLSPHHTTTDTTNPTPAAIHHRSSISTATASKPRSHTTTSPPWQRSLPLHHHDHPTVHATTSATSAAFPAVAGCGWQISHHRRGGAYTTFDLEFTFPCMGLSAAKPPSWWRSDDGTATTAAPCGVGLVVMIPPNC
uniref:CCHC-type domain-containing protein n=1 Tax=Tanacetum cinerariifolium TaxID=118510 RepID=A0A6L2LF68_TANCI|nr:hypothetical protein [Tanacetum cinerariifolium]